MANKAHTGSCWKAGMVAGSRFTASWDPAGWLTVSLAWDPLPGSALAEARQKDAISEAATLWAHGDGGHRWNGPGVSRTTAVPHGAGAPLPGRHLLPGAFIGLRSGCRRDREHLSLLLFPWVCRQTSDQPGRCWPRFYNSSVEWGVFFAKFGFPDAAPALG